MNAAIIMKHVVRAGFIIMLAGVAVGSAARAGERVWLCDLPEQNAKVGFGEFGKRGQAGFGGHRIVVDSEFSPHGLGMHPEAARVDYQLGKKYRTFQATAAMNDSAGDGTPRPVIFRVFADGVQIWESKGMYSQGDKQACVLNIEGVETLRLSTLYKPGMTGGGGRAHAVWLEPFVDTDPPPTGIIPLPKPELFQRDKQYEDFKQQVRAALEQEKFDRLEELAAEARTSSQYFNGSPALRHFYELVDGPAENTEAGWKLHLERLDRWQKAQPKSVTPLITIGENYISFAWRARGSGYAHTVSQEGWRQFGERLEKSRQSLEAARKMDGTDPHLYATLVTLAKGQGLPREQVDKLVDESAKLDLLYFPTYERVGSYLLPRWYGEPGDAVRFAHKIRDLVGGERGGQIFARIGMSVFYMESPQADDVFAETGFSYADLKPGMLSLVRDYPESNYLVQMFCRVACAARDEETARVLMDRIGGSQCLGNIWGGEKEMERWRHWVDPARVRGQELKTLWSQNFGINAIAFAHAGRRRPGSEAVRLGHRHRKEVRHVRRARIHQHAGAEPQRQVGADMYGESRFAGTADGLAV